MFDLLRRKKKSIFGLILVFMCAALMVSFGLDTYNTRRAEQTKAIQVDGQEIAASAYREQIQRVEQIYRQRFGENFEMFRSMINVEQQAIDSLIEEQLFAKLANRWEIGASEKQIQSEIQSHPYFAGGFTQDKWKQFLRQLNLSERELIRITHDGVRRDQITSTFADLATPSESELKAAFDFENRKASFLAAVFRFSDIEKSVESDPTKLRDFYTSHLDLYRRPRGASFVAYQLKAEDFEKKVDVSEDDLRLAYEEHPSEFAEPKQIRSQIIHFQTKEKKSGLDSLLNTKPEESKPEISEISGAEAVKARAKEVLEKLRAGESFETVTAALATEQHVRVEDLGWKTLENIPEFARNAARNIEPLSASDAFPTDDGVAILYAQELKERRNKPFEEVRAQIEQNYRKESAPIYLSQSAEELYEQLLGSNVGLEQFATNTNLTPLLRSEGVISAAENPPWLKPEHLQKVLKMQAGEKQLFPAETEYLILEVVSVREEETKPFEEVESAVLNDFRRAEAKRIAGERALKLLDTVKSSGDDKALVLTREATSLGAQIEEKKEVARQAAEGGIFASADNTETLFALHLDAPLVAKPLESQGEVTVALLTGVTNRTGDDFAKEKKEILERERTTSGERLMQAALAVEKRYAEIEVNPELTKRESF